MKTRMFISIFLIIATQLVSAQMDTTVVEEYNATDTLQRDETIEDTDMEFYVSALYLPFGNADPFIVGNVNSGVEDIKIGMRYKKFRLNLITQWAVPQRHTLGFDGSIEAGLPGIESCNLVFALSYNGSRDVSFTPVPGEHVNAIIGSISAKFQSEESYVLLTYGRGWYNYREVIVTNHQAFHYREQNHEGDLKLLGISMVSFPRGPWHMEGKIMLYFPIRSIDSGIVMMRHVNPRNKNWALYAGGGVQFVYANTNSDEEVRIAVGAGVRCVVY